MRQFIIPLLIVVPLTLVSTSAQSITTGDLPTRYVIEYTNPLDTPFDSTALDDLDGDGVEDYALSMPSFRVEVRSGRDGAIIRIINAIPGESDFGRSISDAGDVDGDGIRDLVVGSPSAGIGGKVHVYSGADGTLMRTFVSQTAGILFGFSVDGIGDINGDGRSEVIVAAPAFPAGSTFNNQLGLLAVFDVEANLPLFVFPGPAFGIPFSHVLGVGDVNADGVRDFAAVAGGQAPFNLNGLVLVFSGVDASVIRSDAVGAITNVTSDAGRDFDGDGVEDYVVVVDSPFGGLPTRVRVYSGATGAATNISVLGNAGISASFLDDVSGDGLADVVVGGFTNAGNAIFVYGGPGLTLLNELSHPDTSRHFRLPMNSLGDIDGDGFGEFLISDRSNLNSLAPANVHVLSAIGVRSYQSSIGSLTPLALGFAVGQSPIRHIGTSTVSGAPPFAPGIWAFSTGRDDTLLFGATVLIDTQPFAYIADVFTFGPAGSFTFPTNLRIPALAGESFFFQCFAVTNGVIAASNGLELLFSE